MDQGINRQFVVFNLEKFTEEQRKADGHTAHAVLGYVQAPDENHAQDTASQIFPDLPVFVREFGSAEPEYVAAAEKMGVLNTSQAHRGNF
jgi:hypothetical protein